MYKSEAASWFRIYEMFRFDSFHMYGVIGTALFFGTSFVFLIKRYKLNSVFCKPINISPKDRSFYRYIIGGIIFGLGWALVGACPGPILVMVDPADVPLLFVLIAATFGTFWFVVFKNTLSM